MKIYATGVKPCKVKGILVKKKIINNNSVSNLQ